MVMASWAVFSAARAWASACRESFVRRVRSDSHRFPRRRRRERVFLGGGGSCFCVFDGGTINV